MPKDEEQLSLSLTCGLEPPKPYLTMTTHCPFDGTEMTLDFEDDAVAGDVACPKCGAVCPLGSEEAVAFVRQAFRRRGYSKPELPENPDQSR